MIGKGVRCVAKQRWKRSWTIYVNHIGGSDYAKKWDRRADIIIIGAGTAGLCAAMEARKAGESVLILEKMRDAEWRSRMPVIAGVVDFAGTKYQEEPSGISVRIQTRLPCKSDDKQRI